MLPDRHVRCNRERLSLAQSATRDKAFRWNSLNRIFPSPQAPVVLGSTAYQIDSPNAAVNVQPDGGLGVPVRIVGIAPVAFLQPAGVDAADAPVRFGDHSD